MIDKLSTADPETGRPLSRAKEAAALGISRMHLWRLRAAERRGEAEWARERAGRDRDGDDLDRFDHPYMELVDRDAPIATTHPWATVDDRAVSEDRGTYHVGGQVRSILGGQPIEKDPPKKSRHKHRPKIDGRRVG